MTQLSDIGEFGLINRFSKLFNTETPSSITGIGDDCAVIPAGKGSSWLITTDMLIEGRHFLTDKISPQDLGYKSLAVNLSDIAAMGGTPHSICLSIGISKDTSIEWLDQFFEGLHNLCKASGTLLIGGDTTKSDDKMIINIVAMGKANDNDIKLRSAARPGDNICVTARLGDSAAGLYALLNELPADETVKHLIQQHHHPKTFIEEGKWLGQQESVHAMIDVSDGIESDLQHIIDQSAAGAEINLENIPISSELAAFSKQHNLNPEELAITGGEDYCLLFTIDSSQFEVFADQYKTNFGCSVFKIGTIKENKQGIIYKKKGHPVKLSTKGFDHFH